MTPESSTTEKPTAPGTASTVILVVLGVLLAATLVFLFFKAEAIDLREKNEILATLRELKAVDTRWDLDVLRARSEIVPRPNSLADRAATAEQSLKRVTLVAWTTESRALDQGLEDLQTAFAQKSDFIETLWQESTAARRALQAGLSLAEEAAERARTARRIVPRLREPAVRAEAAAKTLAASLLRYHYVPGKAQRRALDDAAGTFLHAADDMPAPLGDIAGRMTLELQKLYQYRTAEERLYAKLAFLTTGPRVDALTNELNHEVAQTLAEKERYHVYIACTGLALLILVAYLGVRTRGANNELKLQIAARTRELSEVLDQLKKAREA